MMNEKNRARRTWRRRKIDANHVRYKTLRNKVQDCVHKAKEDYYNEVFGNLNDAREVWTKLRPLGLIKDKDIKPPLVHSPDELNTYFASVSTRSTYSPAGCFILNDLCYDDSKFYWKDIDIMSIIEVVERVSSGSVGVDSLPAKLIKIARPFIAPYLGHIFNYSLQDGVFPNLWKSAIICSIPKVKMPETPSQYRPISILCMLSLSA